MVKACRMQVRSADIEEHSVEDYALWEVISFEINRQGWALAFKLKSPHLPRASQSNQPRKLCDRTVYVGQDGAAGPSTRRYLAAALDRHWIKTELITGSADADRVAATLLSHAFDKGCDTVVIGAVTHELMEKATLPVLFAK